MSAANEVELQSAIQDALAPLSTRFGIRIEVEPGVKSGENISFTVRTTCTKNADQDDKEQQEWNRCIAFTPLQPDDLGREIKIRTRTFTIIGFNPQARKNCIRLSENRTGAEFFCALDVVLDCLGRKQKQSPGELAAEKAMFKSKAASIGFPDLEYGTVVEYAGKRYTLIDINPRAPRYPFIVEIAGRTDKVRVAREVVALGKIIAP